MECSHNLICPIRKLIHRILLALDRGKDRNQTRILVEGIALDPEE